MAACEKQLNLARVRLCVREGNSDAIRLYETLSYRVVDTWHQYYKDGSNALVMEKDRSQSKI
jgi:ribosomal protein S18 acetylase RimI-like enzyme